MDAIIDDVMFYAVLMGVLLVIGIVVMSILTFKKVRKREKELSEITGDSVDMSVMEGIPNMRGETDVLIVLEDTYVTIKSKAGTETAKVEYSQITDFDVLTESEIKKTVKKRNNTGQTDVGGLQFGHTGVIVDSTSDSYCLIFNYTSSDDKEIKVLSFKNGGELAALFSFEIKLKSRILRSRTEVIVQEENVRL